MRLQVIVHVWKGVTNVTKVLADGHSVLRNVGYDNTSWYLDNLGVRWVETPPAPAPRAVLCTLRMHCVCTACALPVQPACVLRAYCICAAITLRVQVGRGLRQRAVPRRARRALPADPRRARRDVGRDRGRVGPAADGVAAARSRRREALVATCCDDRRQCRGAAHRALPLPPQRARRRGSTSGQCYGAQCAHRSWLVPGTASSPPPLSPERAYGIMSVHRRERQPPWRGAAGKAVRAGSLDL